MNFLQVSTEIATDLINKTFNVSPTTVYGLLLLFLALGVTLLSYVIYKLWKVNNDTIKEKDKYLLELNKSTIDVLKDLENVLDNLQNIHERSTSQILSSLHDAKLDITEKILILESNVKKAKDTN